MGALDIESVQGSLVHVGRTVASRLPRRCLHQSQTLNQHVEVVMEQEAALVVPRAEGPSESGKVSS